MSKHALIFGSTGLIGTQLLHELANGRSFVAIQPLCLARSAESGRAGDAGDDPSLTPAVPPAGEEGDAPAGLFDVVTLVNRRPHHRPGPDRPASHTPSACSILRIRVGSE